MTKLGDFYDSENESLEFKDFYLKVEPDMLLNENEIKEVILTGKWNENLNKLIDINIRQYLKSYIPKYVSCYMNSKINGNLIFGIDDIGEITGIPYKGNIDYDKTLKYIKKTVSKFTKGLSNFDNINVNIIKLNYDLNILEDNAGNQINILKNKNEEYNRKINEYRKNKKKWMEELSKYSTKFYNILNNKESRKRVIEYCKKFCPHQYIIDYVDNDQIIEVKCNTKLYERFRDPNDVMYWAGKYKDDNIEKLKLTKPSRKDMPKLINNSLILRKISDMRLRFLSNNDNINYFLININIDGRLNSKNIKFKLDNKSNEWYSRNRIIIPTGPSCI